MARPILESFRRFIADRRAESGMGALLIFIASILVAAVAAGVIIQSTYMAQQRAQSTAELSIQDVSDGWKILSVEGEVNDDGTALTHVYLKTALHAGSYPLYLRHTVIEITDGEHEGNLYLDSEWDLKDGYFYVLYNATQDATQGMFLGYAKNASKEEALEYFNSTLNNLQNGKYYLFEIKTFHIEYLTSDVKVYETTYTAGSGFAQTGEVNEISSASKTLSEIKLQALIYVAKQIAKPGISYTVIVIRDPNDAFNESTPNMVVTQGAILKLIINVSGWNIGPQKHVTIKMMPKHGVPTLEEFWTPPTYARQSYISLT
ncbi:MAG TPA: hypothetical protein ENK81_00065 [Euryarchaeota archaeon]|nr:hypothetical protein [Euryarchaeota archaeon]